MKKIYVSRGRCGMAGFRDWDDLYMAAEEDAYMEMPEGLEDWLEEYYKGQYEFDMDFEGDMEDTYCILFLKLDLKALVHYKMVWG